MATKTPIATKKVSTNKKTVVKKQTKKKQSLLSRVQFKPAVLVLSVLLIGLIGAYFLFSSKAAGPQLTWAPPKLENPTTITLTSSNRKANLDPTKDYIVKLGEKITGYGAINIVGGRNVVLIGGEINHTETGGPSGDPGKDQRGLYLQNWTGTMHIEGIYISGTTLAEGIDVDTRSTTAVLQLQNIRIDTVRGTQATNHADIVQNWGGPVTYRIDRLTGSSTYQGFFVQSKAFGPMTQTLDFRNVNVSGADGLGKYLFYNATGLTTANVKLTNVWSKPLASNSPPCGCYPHSDPVWAAINPGTPPGGDFVPAGSVGRGYVSPGYIGTTTTTDSTGSTGSTGGTTTTPTTPTTTTPVTLVDETFTTSTGNMQQVLGTWKVSNGKYVLSSVKSSAKANANIAVNSKTISGNYTLTTDARVAATSSNFDDFSVLFNYVDKSNYYYVSFNESNDGGTSGIFKVKDGNVTELKDITSLIKADTDYKVTVVKSGNEFKVSLNDVSVATVTDATFTSGKVGYGSRNNAVSYDNLKVVQ
jgi:hypothetical protein